jgi:hypothetical protein
LHKIIDGTALGRPKLKAGGPFLPLDNAFPHLCNAKSEEPGIRKLFHSPYSRDLAPCDLWPFGYLQQCLEGQSFDNLMALQADMPEISLVIEVGTFVRMLTE